MDASGVGAVQMLARRCKRLYALVLGHFSAPDFGTNWVLAKGNMDIKWLDVPFCTQGGVPRDDITMYQHLQEGVVLR